MNTAELLAATFADHEPDAPDVTDTRLRIEAALDRPPNRRPLVVGAVAASVAVAAVALASGALHSGTGADHTPTPTHAVGSHRSVAPTTSPTAAASFPFRPGWLPAGATFDHYEIGNGNYRLQDYTFGTVDSAQRGLTLWSNDGPLPDRLRDGGTLHHTTIQGRPAVLGWSPSSRSYTVAVAGPGHLMYSVLAYGWDRATVTAYATRTAQGLEFGRFPPP